VEAASEQAPLIELDIPATHDAGLWSGFEQKPVDGVTGDAVDGVGDKTGELDVTAGLGTTAELAKDGEPVKEGEPGGTSELDKNGPLENTGEPDKAGLLEDAAKPEGATEAAVTGES